ncbi:SRPBCC family protein [Fodinicola acaciae]|uniref:SRPBCC family protein n=1 Tax=Fodinicola acaciae TaxID=2681555 RepID=UPI0013D70E55|nr:SRPBCC family protein [Fodinicola acaciae]
MPSQHIRASATSSADPATVFSVLRDGSTWPTFSSLGAYELITPGCGAQTGQPDELGEVRYFHTGRYHVREQIVELVQDRRLSYVLLEGLALRDYRADIDLEPAGGGTRISWHSSFDPKVIGTGWLYRRQLTGTVRGLVDGLARRAEEVAASR